MTSTEQKELPIMIYDCFSSRRFGGNVGGIVLDAQALETEQMQQTARAC
ncbi:MAG: PhzF family phenazine biosynthesis protein [Marinosulfonomonas sp.]|nr:PhzF family phenazine biosynthesis protein [Marinosulfonomonas sp.]